MLQNALLQRQISVQCAQRRAGGNLWATASSAVMNLYLGFAPRLRMPGSVPLTMAALAAMWASIVPAHECGAPSGCPTSVSYPFLAINHAEEHSYVWTSWHLTGVTFGIHHALQSLSCVSMLSSILQTVYMIPVA